MTTCTKARQLDQALELLKQTQSQRLGATFVLFSERFFFWKFLNLFGAIWLVKRSQRWWRATQVGQGLPTLKSESDLEAFENSSGETFQSPNQQTRTYTLSNKQAKVDIMLLGSVLGTCERLNKWRTALHVFEQSLRCLGPSNIQQSLPCCHHVLATCTKATRWSVGLQLLHALEDRQLEPDALTFAAMMEAQSCSSSWKAALWSLERMWMQQLMPSGKLQALQADISCRVQAWWYFNYSLASLTHFTQREVLPALPLPASKSWHQKDPDEGKVYRLSDVTLQLRTAGSLPVLLELQFLRKVFQPAVVEAKELILRGSPMQVGLGPTGLPNILSLATTGLGGLERDAMALLLWALSEKDPITTAGRGKPVAHHHWGKQVKEYYEKKLRHCWMGQRLVVVLQVVVQWKWLPSDWWMFLHLWFVRCSEWRRRQNMFVCASREVFGDRYVQERMETGRVVWPPN